MVSLSSSAAKPGHVDYVLLLAVLVLFIFGLVMITSIGVPKSIQLSRPASVLFPTCGAEGVDCYLLLKRHAVRLGIGILAFIIGIHLPHRFWRKISIPLFFSVFILLISVFVIGSTNNTAAKSWINLYNSSIQPSEIAKLALILYLARWMENKGREIKDFRNGFLSFAIVASIVILPVLLQPDVGSTLVFAFIAASVYFVAGARWRHILLGLLVVLLFTLVVVPLTPHLRYRFIAFLHPTVENCQPEVKPGETLRNYCWQTEQANIAVGSGGIFGKGLTQGIQKSYWLPQATDDFIFAASAEELGFLRILLIVLAYAVIAYRGFTIAHHAPDTFSMLTAAGITAWITFQAFINISVNIGLFPITGITLPFVSYGGTSLVTSLAAMGILLHISRYTPSYAYRIYRRRDRGPYLASSRRYQSG